MKKNKQDLVDFSVFEQYREIMGDETDEFINEIVQVFIQSSKELATTLHASFKQADIETFHRTAHSLKSNLKTVGANLISEKFAQLEDMSSTQDFRMPFDLVSEALVELNAVRQELYSHYR